MSFSGPVVGIDEVGRGPLAGPVMAACVLIPETARDLPFWGAVADSKKLSAPRREKLEPLIAAHTLWGVGEASVAEIDALNILQATFLAMGRAFEAMRSAFPATPLPVQALVDGNRAPRLPVPVMTVIRGDQTSLSIAAASILAKVARDRVMAALSRDFPAYGWDSNAGYGSAAHLEALARLGPCPHHRTSFAPVRNLIAK